MSKMKALVCRECGKGISTRLIHVCEMCFGPLEVKYNYDEIKQAISRKKIEDGPDSMWRYLDLLPVGRPSWVLMRDLPHWSARKTSVRIMASMNSTLKTTPSIIRRSRSKIGSLPWLSPGRVSSALKPWPVPEPVT